jgi:hypothetical protein
MKLNILTLALAATLFSTLGVSAQVVIEERRDPVIVEHDRPADTSVSVKERGGFLGTESKTTTETTGSGVNGDCSTRTVHKEGIGGEKTVSKTNCQ